MSLKTVLFFTGSEYGQANVVLAIAYELLQSNCDVRIASFPAKARAGDSIQKRILALGNGVYGSIPTGKHPVFHAIKSASMIEVILRTRIDSADFVHGTGVKEAVRMAPILVYSLCAWDGPEYMEGAESCIEIIKRVQSDVIVVENLCI
jgi:hypothetical protein